MWTVSRVSTVSTPLIIPNIEHANMAHPNMEDANLAPLNRLDSEFPDKNIIIIMSKSTGVARFGPKINENQHSGLGSGSHGLQELKKRAPRPKTGQKKSKNPKNS